jgi:transcriptional regulator with XRE-family HTH domain
MERKDIEKKVSLKLKELRRSRNMTLQDFEKFSGGEIKAVVIGSYERGTRSISLAKIVQLADIYQVPVDYFFQEKVETSSSTEHPLVIDLRRLRATNELDESLIGFRALVARIITKRLDWNGEVLTLRSSDIDNIEFVTGIEYRGIYELLTKYRLLFAKN